MKALEFPLAEIPIPFKYQLAAKRNRPLGNSKRRHDVDGGADRKRMKICLDDMQDGVGRTPSSLEVLVRATNTPNETDINDKSLCSTEDGTCDNISMLSAPPTAVVSNTSSNPAVSTIPPTSVDTTGANANVAVSTPSTVSNPKVTTGLVTSGSANESNVNNSMAVDTAAESGIMLDDGALPLSPIASTRGSASPILKSMDLIEEYKDKERAETERLLATIKASLGAVNMNHLIYSLLSGMHRSELSDISTLLRDNLKRDFVTSLPLEITLKILNKLPFESISNCLQVSKSWNRLINGTPALWKHLLLSESFVSKDSFDKKYPVENNKLDPPFDNDSRYRQDFLMNCSILQNWYNPDFIPQRTTLKGHMTSVVTCLQFEDNYVITGADDKMIRIYDSITKKFLIELSGHDGGVWALKYAGNGILVSGSTDRSVRIWNIHLGKCTHVFKGHTSTVRCLDIVEHEGVKYIVTGSRDNTLHIWKLPQMSDSNIDEGMPNVYSNNGPLFFHSPEENPYFVGVLRGHIASVRTVSGHGRIVISGSYDNNLIVWDIIQMKCLYILMGHTDRIYSTIYDYKRNRCISASMDSTIKIWDLQNIWNNGECVNVTNATVPCTKITGPMMTLQGHTALVGLLKLSDKFLVSAAADGSLRGWDSSDYSRKFAYHHNNLSAITTFYMTDNILVSGSEGQFNIYNLRTGKLIHSNILNDADQIWSVNFKGNILVAAVEKDGQSFVEILDFSKKQVTFSSALHNENQVECVTDSSSSSLPSADLSTSLPDRPYSSGSTYSYSSNAIVSSSE